MKQALIAAGILLGLYLTGRAIAEPFVIHWGDPASYRSDWGGPSLIGVLAVHCLPGLILPAVIGYRLRHRGPKRRDLIAGRRDRNPDVTTANRT